MYIIDPKVSLTIIISLYIFFILLKKNNLEINNYFCLKLNYLIYCITFIFK